MGCWLLVAVVVVVVVVVADVGMFYMLKSFFWLLWNRFRWAQIRLMLDPPFRAQIATKNKLRLSIL